MNPGHLMAKPTHLTTAGDLTLLTRNAVLSALPLAAPAIRGYAAGAPGIFRFHLTALNPESQEQPDRLAELGWGPAGAVSALGQGGGSPPPRNLRDTEAASPSAGVSNVRLRFLFHSHYRTELLPSPPFQPPSRPSAFYT